MTTIAQPPRKRSTRRNTTTLRLPPAALAACLLLSSALAGRELVSAGYRSSSAVGGRASLEKAIAWSPSSWRPRVEYAEILRSTGDRFGAIEHYRGALDRFAGCPTCWIGIAEAQLALREDPRHALDQALKFGRSRTDVRTRAASVYARLGDDELAAREFAAAALGKREDQADFFSLLTRIYGVPFVLERIIPDELLESYFRFARAQLPPNEVAMVWKRYGAVGGGEQRHYYTGYLIRHGLVRDAWAAQFPKAPWRRPMDSAIIDPRFDEVSQDFGWFGWHMADAQGVRVSREICDGCGSNDFALHIAFDGEHNPHFFGVRQDIPLRSNRGYRIEASARSTGITSTSGVALFVQGLPLSVPDKNVGCSLWVPGEAFTADNDWRRTSVEFYLPRRCEGIRLLVGRPRSPHLNKFIGGEFWLDDVGISEIPYFPDHLEGS